MADVIKLAADMSRRAVALKDSFPFRPYKQPRILKMNERPPDMKSAPTRLSKSFGLRYYVLVVLTDGEIEEWGQCMPCIAAAWLKHCRGTRGAGPCMRRLSGILLPCVLHV